MTHLISKIQYDNFETGEFVGEQERTYEETIALIEHFPWAGQSSTGGSKLTKPSVTISGAKDDYIKVVVFYRGKYLLHYLDHKKRLYTKSFDHLADTYQYIKAFFTGSFDITDFRKEITLFQNKVKHFVNGEFNYTVSKRRIRQYLLSTSGINFAFSLIFIFILPFYKLAETEWYLELLILLFMFFLGGGINLILFFNYYFYAKDKILILSQGNDQFFYGNINEPLMYHKNDIYKCTIVQSHAPKSPIYGFAFVIIELKDGTTFKIPNLLIDENSLEYKLCSFRGIQKNGFPFLKKQPRRS